MEPLKAAGGGKSVGESVERTMVALAELCYDQSGPWPPLLMAHFGHNDNAPPLDGGDQGWEGERAWKDERKKM